MPLLRTGRVSVVQGQGFERVFIDDPMGKGSPTGSAARPSLPDGLHLLPWDSAELAALLPQWERLAQAAATPNPFYEPWFLLPSLRGFDPDVTIPIAVFLADGDLMGVMPLERNRRYYGRKLPHLSAWLHPNAFCALPLIRAGHERAFWLALLDHADLHANGACFLHLPQIPADGPATAALHSVCADRPQNGRVVRRESRALLHHGPTPDQHLEIAMSAKKRKELRRQRKRLEEEGTLAFARHRDNAGLDGWIDRFLSLEQAGWKGINGSALACDPRTAVLFREVLSGAAASGKLERLELTANGAPVAMLANFLSPPGAFSFKTTFDENFSRFSPGVLLQIENLALLEDSAINWCDSCASADHPMIERIWRDRRHIIWFTIPIGGPVRRMVGATLAALEARRSEKRA